MVASCKLTMYYQAVAVNTNLNGNVSAFGVLQPPATNHPGPSSSVG